MCSESRSQQSKDKLIQILLEHSSILQDPRHGAAFVTHFSCAACPLMRYLLRPPITICRQAGDGLVLNMKKAAACRKGSDEPCMVTADLPGDRDVLLVCVAWWAVLRVVIVPGYRDCRLGDAGLTLLVHQLLQVCGSDLREHAVLVGAWKQQLKQGLLLLSHLGQVLDTQNKTDGVQDIGLAATIQARDCIERLVKIGERHPLGIRLEALNGNLADIHSPARHSLAVHRPFKLSQ